MAGEDNKRLTRKFIDATRNTGHYDEAREHLATDFVNHTPFREETRDEFLARIQSVRDAFPDWRMTVDDMLADGDFVITRWTGRLLQQLGATVRTGLLGRVISKVVASVTWSGAISW